MQSLLIFLELGDIEIGAIDVEGIKRVNKGILHITPDDIVLGRRLADDEISAAFFVDMASEHASDKNTILRMSARKIAIVIHQLQGLLRCTFHHFGKGLGDRNGLKKPI